jgi:hypothetical protein
MKAGGCGSVEVTKEKLDRLQKWILMRIHDAPDKYIQTEDIYQGYYGLVEWWGGHHSYRPYVDQATSRKAHSAWPVVCSSLRRLKEQGLIWRAYYYPGLSSLIEPSDGGNAIFFTDEGRNVANSLKLKGTIAQDELKDNK